MDVRTHNSGGAGFWCAAAAHPHALALVTPDGEEVSFAWLAEKVSSTSHGLRALGVAEGDVVAVYLPNGEHFFVLALAALQIGAYFVPVNSHLTGPEAQYIVADSGAAVLVAGSIEIASAICAAGPVPRHRFVVEAGAPEGWRPLGELAAGRPSHLPAGRTAGELMGYTSGTTGRPKGVRRRLSGLPPEQAIAPLLAMAHAFGYRGETGAHLVCSPLYHAAPCAFALASLHLGHTVVVHSGFDPEKVLRDIERFSITETHMVPTHFHRLMLLPRQVRESADLSSLRSVLHAGAACPVHLKQAMIDWVGPILWEYLAATEGGVSMVGSRDWLCRPGTVGRPFRGVRVEILDDDGQPVPAGEAGTIYFSTPDFEYHNDPEKTAASRKGDLRTVGDVGLFDAEGYLFVLDRREDLIVSGGVNIYPAEIEGHLSSHPAVADVVAFGVPDDEWGASVVAMVSPVEGAADDEAALAADLLAHCERGLAGFKRPKHLLFGPVPRTPSGKLSRAQARARYLRNEGA